MKTAKSYTTLPPLEFSLSPNHCRKNPVKTKKNAKKQHLTLQKTARKKTSDISPPLCSVLHFPTYTSIWTTHIKHIKQHILNPVSPKQSWQLGRRLAILQSARAEGGGGEERRSPCRTTALPAGGGVRPQTAITPANNGGGAGMRRGGTTARDLQMSSASLGGALLLEQVGHLRIKIKNIHV